MTLSRARQASFTGGSAIQRAGGVSAQRLEGEIEHLIDVRLFRSQSALSSSPSAPNRRPSFTSGSPASSSPIFRASSFLSSQGVPISTGTGPSPSPVSHLNRLSSSPSGLGFAAASRVAGVQSSFGSRSPLAPEGVGARPILGHSPSSSTAATAGAGIGRHASAGSYSRSVGRSSSSLSGNWGGRADAPEARRFASETSAEEAAEIEAFMAELDGRPSLRPPSRSRSSTGAGGGVGLGASVLSRKEEVTEQMRVLRGSVLGVEGLPGGGGGGGPFGGGSRASPSPPTHLGSSPRLLSLRKQGSALSIREEAEGPGSEASTAVPGAGMGMGRRVSSGIGAEASRPGSGAGFAPYVAGGRARTPSNMPLGSSDPVSLGSSPGPLAMGVPNARTRHFDVPPADSPRPTLLNTGSTNSLDQSQSHSAVDAAHEIDEAVGRLELGDSVMEDQILAVNPALVPLPEERGRGMGGGGGWSVPGSRERTPGSGGGGEFPFARGAKMGGWGNGMEFDG